MEASEYNRLERSNHNSPGQNVPHVQLELCKQSSSITVLRQGHSPESRLRSNSKKRGSGQFPTKDRPKGTSKAEESGYYRGFSKAQGVFKRPKPEILIDKSRKFGNKQRFKPLEKLQEKHLQEDDVDSVDLSVNFGPTGFEEAERESEGSSNEGEKPKQGHLRKSSSFKRYNIPPDEINTDIVQEVPATQRMTPKKTLSKGSMKKRMRTPDLENSPSKKYKRNLASQAKRNNFQKKHSLGFPVKVSNDPNDVTENSEDFNFHKTNYAPVKIVKLDSSNSKNKKSGAVDESPKNGDYGSKRKLSTSPRIRIPENFKNHDKEVKF